MKCIQLIFIALICYTSSAQDPRLFENTWYLHNLIIDGNSNVPPTNYEMKSVPLYFSEPNSMVTSACFSLMASVNFINSDKFTLFDGGMTLESCEEKVNNSFANLYMNNFLRDYFNDIFYYSLIGNGVTRMLTITNSVGDQAIYGDKILSAGDFENLRFAIYPNPTSEMITLISSEVSGNIEIKISDY